MNYRIFIFSRNELKIIIVGTIIGGVFQLICWKYLKNHPELLNNENSKKLETGETRFSEYHLGAIVPDVRIVAVTYIDSSKGRIRS